LIPDKIISPSPPGCYPAFFTTFQRPWCFLISPENAINAAAPEGMPPRRFRAVVKKIHRESTVLDPPRLGEALNQGILVSGYLPEFTQKLILRLMMVKSDALWKSFSRERMPPSCATIPPWGTGQIGMTMIK
jgi:hypothetical protein